MLEKQTPHLAIKHLSTDELEKLYEKYLGPNEKVADLIKVYALNIRNNQLFRIFPAYKIEHQLCIFCNVPMYQKRRRRHAKIENPIECYQCDHTIFLDTKQSKTFKTNNRYKTIFASGLCSCIQCIDTRENNKKALIKQKHSLNHIKPIHYDKLSFLHKLILLTLFKVRTDEPLNRIYSLTSFYSSYPKKLWGWSQNYYLLKKCILLAYTIQ